MRKTTHWLQTFRPREAAPLRLFCFPHAGGGAQTFRSWPDSLPEDLELCAVQLPGREVRLREKPYADVHALARALCPALAPALDKPFMLFGHSMGALIAFETARLLQEQFDLTPERLIVSARVAPQLPPPRPPINSLPQAQFIEALRRMNGTPAQILDDADMMASLAPMLRADFALHEEYQYRPEPRLHCGVVAFGGLRDPEAGRAGLDAWRAVTDGSFSLRMVPGDHFFLHSAQSLFLRMLSIELYAVAKQLSGPQRSLHHSRLLQEAHG
jgi:medium-chain acyl-[acyl-carrier-protein] hydrolase